MCLMVVAVGAHEDYPLILMHNRDEYFARTASPLELNGDDILCSTDVEGGGTWMGVNIHSGAVAALTNVRATPTRSPTRSRGDLVLRTLRGDQAATTSTEYSRYNLAHGVLSSDGSPPALQLSVVAPPNDSPRTQPVPKILPFIAAKSNDHGGQWTTAESDTSDPCTWPKACWLREAVASALASEAVVAARGESGARDILLAALATPMSATSMSGSPHAAAAAKVKSSEWSSLSTAAERRLQRAPYVTPFELRERGEQMDDALYGTVSQTVLVQCKSEKCVFYAYRECARPRKRRRDEERPAAEWTWRVVPL